MTSLDFTTISRLPTAERPLAGLHILVIEDSRFACEALRLLCQRSGARIRRADCLAAARRHLATYRPSVVVIDLGLPDGDGTDLIREAAQAKPPIDVIMAISGGPDREADALAAGAHVFMAKPLSLIDTFQNEIISRLPEGARPKALRALRGEVVEPDAIAFQDDMSRAAQTMTEDADAETLDYVLAFIQGVARSAGDAELQSAATTVEGLRRTGRAFRSELAYLSGLVQARVSRAPELV